MINDDRDLTRAFHDEAANIPVPTAQRQRRRSSVRSNLVAVAAAAVVMVVALGIGGLLVDRRQQTPPGSSGQPDASTSAPNSTPSPSPLGVPAGQLLVGTSQGGVYVLGASGLDDRIFDCGGRTVTKLERSPDGQRLLVICTDAAGRAGGYIWRPNSQPRPIPQTLILQEAAWSPDSQELALLVPGTCTSTAPVCASRIVTYEIASGKIMAVHDEDVLLGNLRWTRAGLSYYRPAEPGQGTFVLEGSTWRRIASDPIAAEAFDGRLLLDRTTYVGGRERHAIVVLSSGVQTVLTNAGLSERPLAFDASGRAVGLREDAIGNASIVEYEGSRQVSLVPGEFGVVATQWNGWLVALTAGNSVAYYSLENRQFGSPMPRLGQALTAIAIRP